MRLTPWPAAPPPSDQCRERAGRRRRPSCADGRRPAGPNLRLTLPTESRDTAQQSHVSRREGARCDASAATNAPCCTGGAIRVSTRKGRLDQYHSPSGRHGPAAAGAGSLDAHVTCAVTCAARNRLRGGLTAASATEWRRSVSSRRIGSHKTQVQVALKGENTRARTTLSLALSRSLRLALSPLLPPCLPTPPTLSLLPSPSPSLAPPHLSLSRARDGGATLPARRCWD